MFDVDPTTAIALLTTGTGIGAVIKTWWSKKTRVQKKKFVKDFLDASSDRKFSITEIKDIIDEHF